MDDDYIKTIFGEKLSQSIIEENSYNCALGISAKTIEAHWKEICEIISTIPTCDDLIEKYKLLGAKFCPADIGVSEECVETLLEYSPFVRNRLTLMRLRKCFV